MSADNKTQSSNQTDLDGESIQCHVLKTNEEPIQEKEYNPFEHSQAKHPTSYWDTLVHLFKGAVGTGVLSLPIAFSESGYVAGVLGVLVTTYFSTYAAYILAVSAVELCRRRRVPALSYQATAHAAFSDGPSILRPMATTVLHICNMLLMFSQIGSACVYLTFIAENVKAVTDVYWCDWELWVMKVWCVIPLLAVASVRKLKYLAPFSTIGSFTVLGGCAVVFYYMFDDLPPIASRNAFGRVEELPRFFGTVFFATGCISLILPLQNEMKKPEQFTKPLGVLNVGSAAVALLYTLFGFFGYIKWGDKAQGTVTLNLPSDHMSAHLVQSFLAIATLISTALSYYVAVTILWENYIGEKLKSRKLLCEYTIRFILVVLTVVISLGVPNLELLVSLTGVLSHCTLATAMPCIIHFLTFWPKAKESPRLYAFLFSQNVVIICLTTVVFVTGMASNLYKIADMYTT